MEMQLYNFSLQYRLRWLRSLVFFVSQFLWVSGPQPLCAAFFVLYHSVVMQQRVLCPMDSDVSEDSLASVFSVNICTSATPPDDRNLDFSCVVTLCSSDFLSLSLYRLCNRKCVCNVPARWVRYVSCSSLLRWGGLFVILRELFCNLPSNMEYILSWQ
jgi:hypothetical protein